MVRKWRKKPKKENKRVVSDALIKDALLKINRGESSIRKAAKTIGISNFALRQ